MKSIYLFLFVSLLFPSLSYSQSNYKAGYVVNSKGDTTKGYINYKEWDNSPKTVAFKKEIKQSEEENFSVNDITAFGVTGQLYYQRYIVTASQDPVEINNMNTYLDTSSRVDTVFLRLLNKGRYLTLYSLKDNLKSRYYILESGESEPYELLYHAYSDLNKDNVIQRVRRYRTQLQNILQKNNINSDHISAEIAQSDYSESDMTRVAQDINGKSSNEFTTPNLFGIRFFAGAGINYTQSKFTGNIDFAKSPASSSTSPAINAGVDFLINKNIQKFYLRAGVSFSINGQYKFVTTDIGNTSGTSTLKFKQYNMSIAPQAVYNIYNEDKLKIFIDAGIAFNLASYGDYKTVTVYNSFPSLVLDKSPELSKAYWSFPLKAGIVLNKRIEIYGGFTPSAPISELVYVKNAVTTYQAGVNYLFK
ncbi:MAG TPA: hypothetical protein VIM89_00730 [Mucilaginibacter sp.]